MTDKKLEQTRLRVQRYRERRKALPNVMQAAKEVRQSPINPDDALHSGGVSVTESVDSVTHYPAIIYALTDPDKRKKLEKVYHSLKNFKVADKVYYGAGRGSVPFDVVGDLLEVTGNNAHNHYSASHR